MPTYEFQCVKCRKRFDLVYTVMEYERKAKKLSAQNVVAPESGAKFLPLK